MLISFTLHHSRTSTHVPVAAEPPQLNYRANSRGTIRWTSDLSDGEIQNCFSCDSSAVGCNPQYLLPSASTRWIGQWRGTSSEDAGCTCYSDTENGQWVCKFHNKFMLLLFVLKSCFLYCIYKRIISVDSHSARYQVLALAFLAQLSVNTIGHMINLVFRIHDSWARLSFDPNSALKP